MLSTREAVHARVLSGEAEPACTDCGGILKPTTVSFGEPMPRRPLVRAEEMVRQSDLVLVVGSTLVVYPAASLPEVAVRSGARLAIVNQTETPLDHLAAVVVRGRAGEILPSAVALAADLG
jgi:NAD-dependent deacetylase